MKKVFVLALFLLPMIVESLCAMDLESSSDLEKEYRVDKKSVSVDFDTLSKGQQEKSEGRQLSRDWASKSCRNLSTLISEESLEKLRLDYEKQRETISSAPTSLCEAKSLVVAPKKNICDRCKMRKSSQKEFENKK